MPIDRDMPQQSIMRFKSWFINEALPLWTAQSYDHSRGGYYEALDFNGAPITDLTRRVRVQARQVYVFTQAGMLGWIDGAEALAAKGFDFLLAAACPDDGARGCVHMLSEDGKVIDDRRDLYDQAFLLLACASRWKASNDRRALTLADNVIAFLDCELGSPHGGWAEDDCKTLPRRQNPHMHLFEGFLALHDATGKKFYLDYAGKVLELMFSVFFDPERGVIREYFDAKLKYLKNCSAIEPGHMFEWVWLLRNYERQFGTDLTDYRRTLFSRASELGEDPYFHGFVGNEIARDAGSERADKRLWPQTEYIKACFAEAGNGDAAAGSRAVRLIDDLFKTYLNTEIPGLWIDEFDKNGAAISPAVPASILYHIFEAVAETVDATNAMDVS